MVVGKVTSGEGVKFPPLKTLVNFRHRGDKQELIQRGFEQHRYENLFEARHHPQTSLKYPVASESEVMKRARLRQAA